ncbi:MaoC family dehydratase N-terminal domain-containing protein [Mycobacterium sp. 236(2023)]|uniref:FAS1-like dehydratase domain-containing protein n=1 Tax=Mycobacterium sp. 236(2023) TaxID=3038163 RepID=UPI00241543BD|nr:MaoC family dehydratase N-terminal domain-containing protein [Mycobacterium sp. 236(2023)]MDG4668077.1 MaoC family dehydratase N-terminal domain-containing protein [Mycobacterium sp. 236(2023)]
MTTTSEPETSSGESEFGKLTAAGLQAFRGKIGVDWPYNRWTTWNEVATRDGIRHYANGFGDDNPLWCDPTYAENTRWGGIVAPPGFLEGAGLTPKVTTSPEMRAAGKGALSGVHMFWAGDHIRYFQPIREGDRIWVRRFYVDIKEKERSRFGGRSAVSVRRRVYWNDAGELIAIWDADFVHTEREAAAKRNTESKPMEQHQYSDEELAVVDAHYAQETVRGAEKRYVEDVAIGDSFTPRYRGPMVTGDVIAWLQGNGRHEIYPYRLNWRNRQRMGGFYSRNEFGAWDSAMRVHWDDDYARSVGARRAYDYGMLRNAWLMHAVTDWMGDDALIVAVDDRVTGFNTLGDLTKITGKVTDITQSSTNPEVVCTLECHNQFGDRTAYGSVHVRLPSREHGLPEYPTAPADHGLLPGMPVPEEGPWAR